MRRSPESVDQNLWKTDHLCTSRDLLRPMIARVRTRTVCCLILFTALNLSWQTSTLYLFIFLSVFFVIFRKVVAANGNRPNGEVDWPCRGSKLRHLPKSFIRLCLLFYSGNKSLVAWNFFKCSYQEQNIANKSSTYRSSSRFYYSSERTVPDRRSFFLIDLESHFVRSVAFLCVVEKSSPVTVGRVKFFTM